MKLLKLGKPTKGTLDFKLQSDDEYGYSVQTEGKESLCIWHNIKLIEWYAEGRIVYLDSNSQWDFSRLIAVKIKKEFSIAAEQFENHYFKPGHR